MTQRPSDRAAQTLRDLGLTDAPLSALEREDALFVLTPDTLLFQDAGGTRRVTLRDLTRIHSDQEGTLRVETPAGTALSASLLGFDPGAVQTFFGGVRDATARAKEQPASPLPQPDAAKTFAPAPIPTPTPAPAATPALRPVEPRPEPQRPAPQPTRAPEPQVIQSPVHTDPAPAPVQDAPAPAVQERAAPTPVVISSSAFSPTRTEPKGPELTRTPDPRPTPAPGAPVTTPAPPAPALRGSAGAAATLARQADLASGLPGRLRVLGVVLFLGAVALAFFQFTGGERTAGLWTLLAGGVGTIALVSLADIARLLVSLAHAAGDGSGVMDVD